MVVESPRKNCIAPVVITAGVLGIVQGLAWFVLSLLAILLHEDVFSPTGSTYVPFGKGLYLLYLDTDTNIIRTTYSEMDLTIIIGPSEFYYFMYFYLVFSFFLLVISIAVLWAAKTGQSLEPRLWTWTANMIILSLLDLILLFLIAHDYHQMKLNTIIVTTIPVTLACVGIVMTLAARGFVLWIINVVLVVILGKHLYNQYKNKAATPDQAILDAYTTGSRPPWETPNSLYDTDRQGYNNKGFRNDNDNPMLISSSQSFTHLPQNDRDNYENRDRGYQKAQNPPNNYGGPNNNNNWNKRNQGDNGPYGLGVNNAPLRPVSHLDRDRTSNNPNQWGQPPRTAKIGRQSGQRSPPLNVNPPFIPDPDYSPPGSPRVRGVLRPKSNYAMY